MILFIRLDDRVTSRTVIRNAHVVHFRQRVRHIQVFRVRVQKLDAIFQGKCAVFEFQWVDENTMSKITFGGGQKFEIGNDERDQVGGC